MIFWALDTELAIDLQLHLRKGIQEWTKQNLYNTTFEKFEVIWSNFSKAVWHKFHLAYFE